MAFSDWLIVGSAVASSVIALGALVVSIVGAVRSTKAAKDAQAARELASSAQWKMSEHLQAIAEAQAKLVQVARTQSGGEQMGLLVAPKGGGRLSARLSKVGRSERLVVANVGTEEVEVLGVDVDPDVSVSGAPSIEGVSLDPGEDFAQLVAITMGTRLPLAVTMRWRDSSGEQERTQKVTFS